VTTAQTVAVAGALFKGCWDSPLPSCLVLGVNVSDLCRAVLTGISPGTVIFANDARAERALREGLLNLPASTRRTITPVFYLLPVLVIVSNQCAFLEPVALRDVCEMFVDRLGFGR
jgi:hypothetical protein